MKRQFAIIAVLTIGLVLTGFFVFKSEAHPTPSLQFSGAIDKGSGWAPAGTVVHAYWGGSLRGTATVGSVKGQYQMYGEDCDFPTGTYTLVASDGACMTAQISRFHTQGAPTFGCNMNLTGFPCEQ